jgi:hypothetical protein
MSVLDRPRTDVAEPTLSVPPVLQPVGVPVEQPLFSEHLAHRWAFVLLVPFVLGAASFALAIGLDANWPMIPAFFLGPFLLIALYVVLMLTAEANSTS